MEATSSQGGANYTAAATAALNNVNSLNAKLGSETGTSIAINGTTTVHFHAQAPARSTLMENWSVHGAELHPQRRPSQMINGDAAGDSVVLNFTKNVNFDNTVVLAGIAPDQVLYNFVGGSNLSGGPSLQINDNAPASSSSFVQGAPSSDPKSPRSR